MKKGRILTACISLLVFQVSSASEISSGMHGDWALPEQCVIFNEIGTPDPGVTISNKALGFYEEQCALTAVINQSESLVVATLPPEHQAGSGRVGWLQL